MTAPKHGEEQRRHRPESLVAPVGCMLLHLQMYRTESYQRYYTQEIYVDLQGDRVTGEDTEP